MLKLIGLNNMKKISKHKNFLIIFLVIILTSGAYLFFSNDLNSEKVVPVAFGSSLASSTTTMEIPLTSLDNKIASDISFLTTLVSLKKIDIDTSIFTNNFFNALKNNAVKIEPVLPGRANPFSPFEGVNENIVSVANVITDQPTQVTDKTVVLNGTINTTSGVTDTYFEYGTTEQSLSNITTTAKQSLVGTFVKNVLGLNSKTTYYYKACAKINNLSVCGEVIPFTTK